MGLIKRCAAATVACLSLTAVSPVQATPAAVDRGGADAVIQRGACSDGADWKLKVEIDKKRLRVEGVVDSDRAGERWRWRIRHNGSVSARGTKRTVPPNGTFRVVRRVVDIRGVDEIVFRAKHAGQVCRGVVNY